MPLRLAALLLCSLTLFPAAAQASKTQESTFQDDVALVYGEPAAVAATMDELKALGVDRLRITVQWFLIAPENDKQQKPSGFDGADPAAYPPANWARYDTLAQLAKQKGLALNFNVTAPAPFWATGSLADRPDVEATFDPNAQEFGKFVAAVGKRYSGAYVPPVVAPAGPPPSGSANPSPGSGLFPRQAPAGGAPLPRVDYWTIYNEPNQPGWLTPQWADDPREGKGLVETAPRIYRNLLDQAYGALFATGHGNDTILIGETAPKGQERAKGPTRAIKPGRFIRQLYCLDDNLQFLRGSSAEVRGCPVSDPAARMIADHPALFRTTGYAHHPYELLQAPTSRPRTADNYTTANLDDLSVLLRRIYQRYGQKPPGGGRDVPLYLTEYGYQTKPQDPNGVSLAKQAAYLNEAEWLTYRNPRVRTLAQFLLRDDGGDVGVSFQSGLQTLEGKPKPALLAYRLPLFLPARRIRRGSRLRVFGLVRPANSAARVELQLRGAGGRFKRLRTLKSDKRGYIDARIRPTRSGVVRLLWRSGQTTMTSRQVSYSVIKKKR